MNNGYSQFRPHRVIAASSPILPRYVPPSSPSDSHPSILHCRVLVLVIVKIFIVISSLLRYFFSFTIRFIFFAFADDDGDDSVITVISLCHKGLYNGYSHWRRKHSVQLLL